MTLFWRGQDYLIGNMKYVSNLPSPSAYFCKVLASTEKKLQFSRSHGVMKVLTGRNVVTYEMLKWMRKLYDSTVQAGTGKKRCLVKEGVEILIGDTEKIIFYETRRGYSYLEHSSGWLIHLEGCYKGLP